MLVEELIEIVEKKRNCIDCTGCTFANKLLNFNCNRCKNYVSLEKQREMYADIQMRLKQEKWAMDKMEEMRVEEVD